MALQERDPRWEELLAVSEEFHRATTALPAMRSRIDGQPRPPSPRAVSFAEALAVSTSWAGISDARARTQV